MLFFCPPWINAVQKMHRFLWDQAQFSDGAWYLLLEVEAIGMIMLKLPIIFYNPDRMSELVFPSTIVLILVEYQEMFRQEVVG